jgi:CHAT domain-containing protein/tetratricopeptide (TPR) repeat protein
MIRSLRALIVVVAVAAGVPRGAAQSPPAKPTSSTAVDEADKLDRLVERLYREGRLQEAIPLAERSLAIREKAHGSSQLDLATSASNLGWLYEEQRAYGKAEPLLVRALDIREKALGPTHLDVATSLNNLAGLYWAQGAYGRVGPLFARALNIREAALGPEHPDVAASLNNLAGLYQELRSYDEAERLYVRALNIREKVLGPVHSDLAQSLNNLGMLYEYQGAYDKAQLLLVRALDMYQKALGSMDPLVAQSLNNLANVYRSQGAYDKAEPLLVRALDIREKVFGPMHPEVAISLGVLARLYLAKAAYGKAESLLVRALDIRKKVFGTQHPDFATGMNDLAEVYKAQGAYSKAEPLLVRALEIHEKTLGPRHPEVAVGLNNLAALFVVLGLYGKAEPLLVRALDIRETALGPGHPEVAESLNNLAALYREQGAYGKAESLYVRALDIFEKLLGASHPNVATSLNNLAGLYWAQGAYRKAEPLLIRALDICEKALGPMHPDVAQSLNNVAFLYEVQGAYDKAESLHVRSLSIRETALGPLHPDVAESLNNLAALYSTQAKYNKAEPHLIRALAIVEKVFGPSDLHVARSLNNLAAVYQLAGAHDKAEPIYVRALDILKNALGRWHPDVATVLNNLATLSWARGAYGQAESFLARAAEIQEQRLRTEFPQLSEPRKRAMMMLVQGETDAVVSLHADSMPASTSARDLALTTILQRKGRILDSVVDGGSHLRSHLTPLLRDKLDALSRARSELIALLYAPAGPTGASGRDAVSSARARIDELETTLSAASEAFGIQSEPVTLSKIQAALPAGAALVEFVRYRRFDARQPHPWQEERYVAYLVTAGGPPEWVALGATAPVDAQIAAVLAAMDSKTPVETSRAALQRLDASVFAPIRARLTSVSHVILAPDGKLNLVPFEALVDSEGRYALDRYLMSYVTTGRDLLRFAAHHSPRSAATIIAAPDYGPPKSTTCDTLGSLCPLKGALGEATDLRRYFAALPLTGQRATKSALMGMTGPAVLHIATHGFYARDASPLPIHPVSAAFAQGGRPRGMFVDSGVTSLLPPLPRFEDPTDGLDRAGLAMAGANQGPEGIVTAREIAGFDWWGSQLVVLSACETGVGAVPSGDGVYGLRRALVLAGAASQVVSLWSVSDASTRQLMRDYYGELARGTGRAEALRQAKLRVLRQPRYAHPYYWAAFIPAGDWRPLDKSVFSPRELHP